MRLPCPHPRNEQLSGAHAEVGRKTLEPGHRLTILWLILAGETRKVGSKIALAGGFAARQEPP